MPIEANVAISRQSNRDSIWFLSSKKKNYRQTAVFNLISAPITGAVAYAVYHLTKLLPFSDPLVAFLGSLLFYLSIVSLAFAAVFYWSYLLWPIISYRRRLKQAEIVSRIAFGAEDVILYFDVAKSPRKMHLQVQALNKVYEIDDYFFVMLDISNTALIIDKRDFTTGRPDDLRLLLQQKLAKKFIEKHN